MTSNVIRVDHWSNVTRKQWPFQKFTPYEMACRGTGMLVIPFSFMERLEKVRDRLANPMHVTSGCRSTEHNDQVGGKPRSFHICDADPGDRGQDGCLAVDIAATDGRYRGRLFSIAWDEGFSVGWNAKRGFLHLDRRVDVGWQQTTFDY